MKADLNKQSSAFIVTGLLQMIEVDGLTFHEAMEVLEDIKRQVFPALMQISREKDAGWREYTEHTAIPK